jgi:FtsP/CotA-like multicopper oxidase with cupredoxin domain
MKTWTRNVLRCGALLAVAIGLAAVGWLSFRSVAQAAPAPAATLPATTCTSTGPAARTCELWAMPGTLGLPGGATVPIWGYSDQAAGPAQLPGPPIVANQGETVTVILHNGLAEASSLVFPEQDLVPDFSGVAPGGTVTYTFVAANPGTFSYEAGLTSNGTRQVAMGLYGGLIVRPVLTPTWAYDDAATAFDEEALLIYSEIDPALNANPAAFNMTDYGPDYFLINGVAYTNTAPIASLPGHKVLLRQMNAGLMQHSTGVLGLDQAVLAIDGNLFPQAYVAVAETIAPGQSLDTLVTVPTTGTAGLMYPVFEQGWRIHNADQTLSPGGPVAFGGFLTFITVGGTPPVSDTVGPLATGAGAVPSLTSGALGVTLTATLDESTTGGSTVVAAEYFSDTLGAPGSGIPIAIGTPAITVPVSVYLPPAMLATLASGEHILYIRGQDAWGNWGPVGAAPFNLVIAGPVVSAMVLTPATTNGTQAVGIQATGDARPSGAADVTQAEYFIDNAAGAPGGGAPMALNQIAPVASLTATIPMATLQGLAEGWHTIYIRAMDSLNNWGDFGQVALAVDKTGPGASALSIAPSPNNGSLAISPSLAVVRLRATFGDPVMGGVNSNLERAESFIDTVGPDGSGNLMTADDGKFHLPVESGYIFYPLYTIQQLAPGPHTFWVHAKDIAGNWGDAVSVDLIIDKAGPDITGLDVQPNPTNRSTGALLSGLATDPANGTAAGSTIVAAEWFRDADPGAGNGTPMAAFDGAFDSASEQLVAAINVQNWRLGDYTLYVRAKDAAGNWGAPSSVVLTVQGGPLGAAIFANGFEAGNFAAWTQAIGAVQIIPQAAMGGNAQAAAALDTSLLGMAADLSSEPAYVLDGTPEYEADYGASFWFNPNGASTGGAEHDIFVGYDLSGTPIFGIQYEHNTVTSYEVRAWVRHQNDQVFTDWYDISNGPNYLEIHWESGLDTAFGLYVDDVLQQSLEGVNTSAYLVDEVTLGPSMNLKTRMSGTEYFDEFSSRRPNASFDLYLPIIAKQ